MDAFCKLFKDAKQALERTGQAGPAQLAQGMQIFDYYEDMAFLLDGDVTTEPIVTHAAGVASETVRQATRAKSSRPIPLKERSLNAIEDMAKGIREKNNISRQLLEHLTGNKSGASSTPQSYDQNKENVYHGK